MRIHIPTPLDSAVFPVKTAHPVHPGLRAKLIGLLLAGCAGVAIPNGLFADEPQLVKLAPSVYQSPDFSEVKPDGTLPLRERNAGLGVKSLAGPIAPAAGGSVGALKGRIVFMHAGHGWTYGGSGCGTLNYWATQRSPALGMMEDAGNQDQMTLFAYYCFNAGATVVPMRPIGHQTNQVVLDNVNAAVTFAGAWTDSTSTIYFGSATAVPYRYASIAATETATATYTPTIPVTGFYPVYCWARHGSDRTDQLYRINHTGGQATVRVPHYKVGNGWVYLGSYYFNAGSNSTSGAAIISNLQPTPTVGSIVIADAIRFGNGMGDIVPAATGAETPTKSGYPREDEAAKYWIQKGIGQGQSSTVYQSDPACDYNSNVTAPPRMCVEMNRQESGSMYDRIYISFHSNSYDGTARGTCALYNNVAADATPNQLRLAELVGNEIEADLVSLRSSLEVAWGTRSPNTYHASFSYGEINNQIIQDEYDATEVEVAFHDNADDAHLLLDTKVRNWVARATYQGMIKYFNEFDALPLVYLPEPPSNVRAIADTNGGIMVSWAAPGSGGSATTNYVVYRSTDGYGFGYPVSVGGTGTTLTLPGLAADTDYYFQVVAVNTAGESLPSETVGCRRASNAAAPKVLYVNSFDRLDRINNLLENNSRTNWDEIDNNGSVGRVIPRTVNSFDYVVQHGKAISACGVAFDSCHRDAVLNNQVFLTNYPIVIWGAGNQLTNNFSSAAQSRRTTFLDGGGNLFASGSKIAWSLDRSSGPTAADRAFLNNQLHCDLTGDANTNSGIYTVTPVSGSIFDGNGNATFDNGTKQIYWVQYADVLTAVGSGTASILNYSGAGAAALRYNGSAGGGKVVLFGFPFETISSASLRHDYMADILSFLTPAVPSRLDLSSLLPSGVQLSLSGQTGATYSVESSTNLLNWAEVTNFANLNGTFRFIAPSPSNDLRRFYRAKQLE
jgi:hypothetical protein